MRQVERIVNVDFSKAVFQLCSLGKAPGDKLRSNCLGVNRDREVVEHALGIQPFFLV